MNPYPARSDTSLVPASTPPYGFGEDYREPVSTTERTSVHGQGRTLILRAAREVFAAKGFKGTSTRDIAKRAQLTEVMIFRHFGTKANLFQEAVITPFTEFMDDYVSDYRSREHGKLSPRQEGMALYTGLFDVLHGERELLLAVMSAHQYDDLSPEASAQINAAFDRLLALFEEVVATEANERHFSDFDLRATVRAMFAMVLSSALHGDWMGLGKKVSYKRMIDAMTQLTVRGLRVPED
jgi:AcrR family transcriptional regulator